MTALQLRAELFREMSPLLDSEAAMMRVLAFVRSLSPAKKEKAEVTERNSYKVIPVSPEIKWLQVHTSSMPEWNPVEAWGRLTDKQREEAATKLHLSAEDMDERTFNIITKHMK